MTSPSAPAAWLSAFSLLLAMAAVLVMPPQPSASGETSPASGLARIEPSFTLALLGDVPYGRVQTENFPDLVDDINDRPAIRLVLHAGDVKDGRSRCAGSWLDHLLSRAGTFDDAFVVTPGDNDWTDCHEPAAGSHLPLDRLAALRDRLFPDPGWTLGRSPIAVQSQADYALAPEHEPYVENVRFRRAGVVFGTVHLVGSRNDLDPWDGLSDGDRSVQRMREYRERRAANLVWIKQVFNKAERDAAAGVLLMMHAEPLASPAWLAERRLITRAAREFGEPVLLVHGNEHDYEFQSGYAGVPNLTRLETFGVTTRRWLAVTVDRDSRRVFSWETRTVD